MAAGKVLVVEDDDSLRRVTELHLNKLGFTTSATATAEQALGMLEELPYDVLLTDLHLPGMSGVDLLKRVKMEHPDLIVIVNELAAQHARTDLVRLLVEREKHRIEILVRIAEVGFRGLTHRRAIMRFLLREATDFQHLPRQRRSGLHAGKVRKFGRGIQPRHD